MTHKQNLEIITSDILLDRVRRLREKGYRLVQIGATRLPEQVELTYTLDLNGQLLNLRFYVPGDAARIPSISSIYGCVVLYENELQDLFNIQVEGMAVDFQGQFYRTAVKFPFGTFKVPAAKGASAGTAQTASTPPA